MPAKKPAVKAVAKKATAKAVKRPAVRPAGPATTIRLIERNYPCNSEYKAFLKAVGGRPIWRDHYSEIYDTSKQWPKPKVKADDPILLSDIANLPLPLPKHNNNTMMTPKQWVEWILSHGAMVGGNQQIARLQRLEDLAVRVFLRCDGPTIERLIRDPLI